MAVSGLPPVGRTVLLMGKTSGSLTIPITEEWQNREAIGRCFVSFGPANRNWSIPIGISKGLIRIIGCRAVIDFFLGLCRQGPGGP